MTNNTELDEALADYLIEIRKISRDVQRGNFTVINAWERIEELADKALQAARSQTSQPCMWPECEDPCEPAQKQNIPATSSADTVSVRTQPGAPGVHIDEYGGGEFQAAQGDVNEGRDIMCQYCQGSGEDRNPLNDPGACRHCDGHGYTPDTIAVKRGDVPFGWHVSWMGYEEGGFLCQMKQHDVDEHTPENEITFVSRKSLRSCDEAFQECLSTIAASLPADEGEKQ